MYKSMMRLFVLFLAAVTICSSSVFAVPLQGQESGKTIYIDPTYNGKSSDGSINKPFKSWSRAMPFVSGTAYLQKRSTKAVETGTLYLNNLNKVTLGAYGNGTRPFILSKVVDENIAGYAIQADNCSNVVIQDLKVEAPEALGVVVFQRGGAEGGNIIKNCDISKAKWGIRIHGPIENGVKILNCEVHETWDDGFFGQEASNVEIGYSHFYDNNMEYHYVGHNQSQSGGDCIQFYQGCSNLYIHHNILDHSSAGNKFQIIVHSDNKLADNILIEYNHMIGYGPSTSNVYLSEQTNVTLRYNVMEHSGIAVYNQSTGIVDIHDNIFNDMEQAAFIGNSSTNFYNNTIYNATNNGVWWSSSNAAAKGMSKNNIFYQPSSKSKVYWVTNPVMLDSDYNAMFPESQYYPDRFSFITMATGEMYNTLAAWRKASGQDMHSISAEPEFKDAGKGDFRLSAGSPAIGSGVEIPGRTGTGPINMGADISKINEAKISVNADTPLKTWYNDKYSGPARKPDPAPVPRTADNPLVLPAPISYKAVLYSKSDMLAGSYRLPKIYKGTVTCSFDITPLENNSNAYVCLGDSVEEIIDLALCPVNIRFNSKGLICIRNGVFWEAENIVAYKADVKYRMRIVLNIEEKTYDVYITKPGGKEIRLANDFAFRSDSPKVDDIGWFVLNSSAEGKYKVQNLEVKGTKTLPPIAAPAPKPEPETPAGTANIALSGTGCTWYGNADIASDANRLAAPGINNGDMGEQIRACPSFDDISGAFQAAGIVWSGPQNNLVKVEFTNAQLASGGNGVFDKGITLQYTADGAAWLDTGWVCAPEYTYDANAAGKTFTFTGAKLDGVLGIRVAGQVHTSESAGSWNLLVSEVAAYTQK